MREIKFRAWEYRKIWVKGKGYTDDYAWKMNYNPEIDGDEVFGGGVMAYANDIKDDENTKWMQFTGLLDKNGKEIYEGDIITIKSDDEELDLTVDVKWDEECCGYSVREIDYWDFIPCLGDQEWDIEVIGNKFENPELLDRKLT